MKHEILQELVHVAWNRGFREDYITPLGHSKTAIIDHNNPHYIWMVNDEKVLLDLAIWLRTL